jgi:hypothetical protein
MRPSKGAQRSGPPPSSWVRKTDQRARALNLRPSRGRELLAGRFTPTAFGKQDAESKLHCMKGCGHRQRVLRGDEFKGSPNSRHGAVTISKFWLNFANSRGLRSRRSKVPSD